MTLSFLYAFIGLLTGHLLADFFLQKTAWVEERKLLKWRSRSLYLHGLIAGTLPMVLAWLLGYLMAWLRPDVIWSSGHWYTWLGLTVALVAVHTCIDIVKSYLPDRPLYFLGDQLLHWLCLLLVALMQHPAEVSAFKAVVGEAASPKTFGIAIISLLLTKPTSYLIQNLTGTLGFEPGAPADSLYRGGELIGMLERQFIFICIMTGHPESIGWMLGAKSILRFSEIRKGTQTEYLLVGTLGSTISAVILSLVGFELFF